MECTLQIAGDYDSILVGIVSVVHKPNTPREAEKRSSESFGGIPIPDSFQSVRGKHPILAVWSQEPRNA